MAGRTVKCIGTTLESSGPLARRAGGDRRASDCCQRQENGPSTPVVDTCDAKVASRVPPCIAQNPHFGIRPGLMGQVSFSIVSVINAQNTQAYRCRLIQIARSLE